MRPRPLVALVLRRLPPFYESSPFPTAPPPRPQTLMQALLHRVFSTAAELWRDEVGARLHQRNYERVAACWHAWQVAVLQAQEQRRQGMLEFAAIALR